MTTPATTTTATAAAAISRVRCSTVVVNESTDAAAAKL